jgi:hypothetical protein
MAQRVGGEAEERAHEPRSGYRDGRDAQTRQGAGDTAPALGAEEAPTRTAKEH